MYIIHKICSLFNSFVFIIQDGNNFQINNIHQGPTSYITVTRLFATRIMPFLLVIRLYLLCNCRFEHINLPMLLHTNTCIRQLYLIVVSQTFAKVIYCNVQLFACADRSGIVETFAAI